jgi:hypothetical protein
MRSAQLASDDVPKVGKLPNDCLGAEPYVDAGAAPMSPVAVEEFSACFPVLAGSLTARRRRRAPAQKAAGPCNCNQRESASTILHPAHVPVVSSRRRRHAGEIRLPSEWCQVYFDDLCAISGTC